MNVRTMLLLLAMSVSVVTPFGDVAAASPDKGLAAEKSDDATRAITLLERATTRLKTQGDRALAEFSRTGDYTDGDLYVYVLGSDGILLASGGASYNYIGRNMLEYRDPDGKKLFAEMLAGARNQGKGRIEYRWLNQQRGTVERKVAYYQLVNERIVAVGYYAPRATPEQAMSVLWRAVDELKRRGQESFAEFNDLNGGFVRDDTYVFVVGLKDRRMHAHGATPRLVGRNVAELTDANGDPIIQKMINIVSLNEEGFLDYTWRNPVTGKNENKRTFLKRVGDYMVGVGYYRP